MDNVSRTGIVLLPQHDDIHKNSKRNAVWTKNIIFVIIIVDIIYAKVALGIGIAIPVVEEPLIPTPRRKIDFVTNVGNKDTNDYIM